MFRVLIASTRAPLRVVVALSSCLAIGGAIAADDPKDPQPDISAAQAARNEPPPVSYNSGAPARKFEADPKKVTMEVLPGGARLYHMNGQGMQAVIAHIDANGKVEYTCTDRAEQAANSAAATANAHEQ